MFGFINRFLPTQYEKRMTSLVAMIILLVGVSLTARLLDEEQDIRQRANETTPPINTSSAPVPTIDQPPPPTSVTIDPLSTAVIVSVNLSSITSPTHLTRFFTIDIFDENNIFISSESTPLAYQNGSFSGTFNIGNLQTGSYTFKISTAGFLQNAITALPRQITKGQQLTLPRITLTPGDINGDRTINSLDYSALNDCYQANTPDSCDQAKKESTDLNDDGSVNTTDYNILIQNIK